LEVALTAIRNWFLDVPGQFTVLLNPDGGIHHICYDDDILVARDKLKSEGASGVLATSNPKIGAHGKPVLFLHPKDFCGTLVELEQA
jgi:methylmalonyl-CoA/ethylmalonyl-CoA epimerase